MATVRSKKADVSSVSPLSKRSKRQLFYSLRWPIYVFNSVVDTKLPGLLSHRRSTTVSLETHPPLKEGSNEQSRMEANIPQSKESVKQTGRQTYTYNRERNYGKGRNSYRNGFRSHSLIESVDVKRYGETFLERYSRRVNRV